MTEIRVDVDLEHLPPAVWRALTEAHLVTDWLPASRFMVRDDSTFTFQASQLEGLEDPIEGEIVTTEAPQRLVMRWSAENLHTVVAITLDERAGGTRLTLTQSGFLGPQGTMRRRVLRRTYQQLFSGPFAATLARQAAAAPASAPTSPAPASAVEPPAGPRNHGGPFNRLPRQSNSASRSAPGLSSQVRSTAGPRPTTTMPGFAAAVLGARATGVASVPTGTATGVASVSTAQVGPDPATTAPAGPSGHSHKHRLGYPARFVRWVRGTKAAFLAFVVKEWRRIAGARDWSADRRSQAIAAAAAVLLLLAMIGLLIGKATAPHPARPPRTGGGLEGPAQATFPGRPGEERSPRAAAAPPSAAPSAPAPATTVPAPGTVAATTPQLTARTRTEDLDPTSYRVTVTIVNPSTAPSTDWTLIIVLPLLDLTVGDVEGAVMSRTDANVAFTPVDSTRTIRNGGSVTIRFEVQGLGLRNAPIGCTIDGRPCTAVSR